MSEPTIERYEEIANECLDLMGLHSIFHALSSEDSFNADAMDARLQELLATRCRYHEGELTAYLRYTWTRNNRLPTWQPLLNATIELARLRGHSDDIFHGLLPDRDIINRNT